MLLPTQDLDGIILVIDPQRPEQEKELETFYMNFAQPHSLTIKQCLTMAIQVVKEGSGLANFNGERRSSTNSAMQAHTCSLSVVMHTGLQGKLSKLNMAFISLNPASPAAGIQVRGICQVLPSCLLLTLWVRCMRRTAMHP